MRPPGLRPRLRLTLRMFRRQSWRPLLGLPLGLLFAAGCGSDVSLCLDYNDGPPSCELCDNGKDDDGDGLVDCRDGDCRDSGYCTKSASASTSTTMAGDGEEVGGEGDGTGR